MSLLGSLFSLASPSGANTDRKTTLGAYGDLSSIFNYGLPQAKAAGNFGTAITNTGLEEMGDAASYFRDILKGGRAPALAAVAPVTNAAAAQTDAQKGQIADLGTGRTGGTNAVTQELNTERMKATDSAIAAARPAAATGTAQVGQATTSAGLSKFQQMLQLLGITSGAAANLGDLASRNRVVSAGLHNQKAEQATDVASGILDAVFG